MVLVRPSAAPCLPWRRSRRSPPPGPVVTYSPFPERGAPNQLPLGDTRLHMNFSCMPVIEIATRCRATLFARFLGVVVPEGASRWIGGCAHTSPIRHTPARLRPPTIRESRGSPVPGRGYLSGMMRPFSPRASAAGPMWSLGDVRAWSCGPLLGSRRASSPARVFASIRVPQPGKAGPPRRRE